MAKTIILAEQTLDGFAYNEKYNCYTLNHPNIPITVGEVYTVVWDGTEYEVTGQDASAFGEGISLIGNGTGWGLQGNDEPFAISTNVNYATTLFTFDTATSHTVGIYQGEEDGVVLKDLNGDEVAYYGVETVELGTTDGGTKTFVDMALLGEIPKKVSELENDSKFVSEETLEESLANIDVASDASKVTYTPSESASGTFGTEETTIKEVLDKIPENFAEDIALTREVFDRIVFMGSGNDVPITDVENKEDIVRPADGYAVFRVKNAATYEMRVDGKDEKYEAPAGSLWVSGLGDTPYPCTKEAVASMRSGTTAEAIGFGAAFMAPAYDALVGGALQKGGIPAESVVLNPPIDDEWNVRGAIQHLKDSIGSGGGSGGTAVNADYAQNDSTKPDYIKNRPFYQVINEEEIVPSSSVEFFTNTDGTMDAEIEVSKDQYDAIVGASEVAVVWNETKYICEPAEVSGITVVGNLGALGAGADTGEPFVFALVESTDTEGTTYWMIIVGLTTAVPDGAVEGDVICHNTFSISNYEVTETKKLDPIFSPIPCHTELNLVELLPSGSYPLEEAGAGSWATHAIIITLSEAQYALWLSDWSVCVVNFNGNTYELEPFYTVETSGEPPLKSIGNPCADGKGTDNGVPFVACVGEGDGGYLLLFAVNSAYFTGDTTEAVISVSISNGEKVIVDEESIPPIDYEILKNKPFGYGERVIKATASTATADTVALDSSNTLACITTETMPRELLFGSTFEGFGAGAVRFTINITEDFCIYQDESIVLLDADGIPILVAYAQGEINAGDTYGVLNVPAVGTYTIQDMAEEFFSVSDGWLSFTRQYTKKIDKQYLPDDVLLPPVTESDNGKVVHVSEGNYTLSDILAMLPAVTEADNGKVLGVVNGAWALMELPSGDGGSST